MSGKVNLIYYHVPTDQDEEGHPNVFPVAKDRGDTKLKDIREKFPLPGTYHFRFKMRWGGEQGNGVIVWMDVTNEDSVVPAFEEKIVCKVLRMSWDDSVQAKGKTGKSGTNNSTTATTTSSTSNRQLPDMGPAPVQQPQTRNLLSPSNGNATAPAVISQPGGLLDFGPMTGGPTTTSNPVQNNDLDGLFGGSPTKQMKTTPANDFDIFK